MTKKKKSKSKSQNSGDARQQQQHHQPTAKSQSGTSSPSASSNANLSKKRKRSIGGSDNSMPTNAPSKTGGDASALLVPHVIQWLEKRKMKIPDALSKSNNLGESSMYMDMDRVLSLLPSLRERERRALIRHVDKCLKHGNGSDGNAEGTTEQLEGSDGEYDIHEKHTNDNRYNLEANGWPSSSPAVEFSNNYKWDKAVPSEIKTTYSPSKEVRRQRANRLSNRVYFKRITDPNHPAHGEYGLYCNIPHATPGMWLLDYVGYITLGEHQDKSSDYVSDFGERSELACDANSFGNEARFLNDVSIYITCGCLEICTC